MALDEIFPRSVDRNRKMIDFKYGPFYYRCLCKNDIFPVMEGQTVTLQYA